MATFEQEETVKTELTEVLTVLSAINAKDLIRASELGKDFNFEIGLPVFERTLKLFKDLYNSNLDNVSFTALNQLLNLTKDAYTKFESIQKFSPAKEQTPLDVRNRLINQILDSYDSYFAAISPIIAYSIRKGTDFETLEKTAHAIVNSMETLKNEQIEGQKKISIEMESILQKVRQAAAEVGVAQHATHFKEEAKEHNTKSKKWLAATIIMALLTVSWGFLSIFFIKPNGDTTNAQVIQFTIGKLIILSALYYALVWSAKNYNAHQHNYVINKHRQNCLNTFETFVKATGNDIDTKNAVLLQTTQSIFSVQASGHVHGESDGESPNKIIEVMRSVKATGQKT